jgi:hypothetical protein
VKRLFLLVAVLAAGCDPKLYAASVPPPGALGRLNTEDRVAQITEGAALAFRCDDGGPCAGARATSDDPAIADVRPAALAQLEVDIWRGMAPSSTFVIVARRPGITHIRVRSGDGDTSLKVVVVPAP